MKGGHYAKGGSTQGGPRASPYDVYFRSLPTDSLTPHEAALRESLLALLSGDPHAPHPFPLGEWIDRRIGAEVDSTADMKGGFAVQLANSGRPAAPQKGYGGMKGESHASPVAHAPAVQVRAMTGDKGYDKGDGKGAYGKDAYGKDAYVKEVPLGDEAYGKETSLAKKENFFSQLPSDGFTADEECLRGALLAFVKVWPHPWAASLSEAGSDPDIRKWRPRVVTKTVSLKDWIERRIGGELDTMEDRERGTLIGFPGKLQAQSKIKKDKEKIKAEREAAKGEKGAGKGEEEKGKGKDKDAGDGPGAAAEEFFTSLPDDDFTDEEVGLREALLERLRVHAEDETQTGNLSLAQATKDPVVAEFRDALLPRGVGVRFWIEERIGSEIYVRKDYADGGKWILVSAAKVEEKQKKYEEKQKQRDEVEAAFFDSLPDDGFQPEEEALREAILKIVDGWTHKEASPYDEVVQCPAVKKVKDVFLPKSGGVSLKSWIENRIGAEVELKKDETDGRICIGRVGKLDAGIKARQMKAGDKNNNKGKGKDKDKGKGKGKDGGGKGKDGGDGACYICGTGGHFARECPKGQGERDASAKRRKLG